MITAKTKRVAVVSVVVFISMVAVVGLAVRQIIIESHNLSEQVAAIAVDRSGQAAFSRLQKLMQETQIERDQQRSYFLESQSDSIDFLNYIELLATERGVGLETVNPTEIEREGDTFLSVGYAIGGSLSQVESFIQTLESVPYVSQLMSIRLQQQSSTLWKADVVIDVAVLTYE